MGDAALAVTFMYTSSSVVPGSRTSVPASEGVEPVSDMVRRVRAEFEEMPGLVLTLHQASRLFQIEALTCSHILAACVDAGFLTVRSGRFVRA
jgi:hypothetical protein